MDSCKVLLGGLLTTNPPWGELSPGKNLPAQRAEVASLCDKIHDCRAHCASWCGAVLLLPSPAPSTPPASGVTWTAATTVLPALSEPNQGTASWKSQTQQGKGKKIWKKKNKSHTGHSYRYEESNELLYIHTVNNFTSWKMSLLSLLFPWGWRVLVWVLAWDVQSHTESTLSVVVGVLNKVDGVGASWWILFDLEVFCRQTKGTQNQIAQILQFAQHFFL